MDLFLLKKDAHTLEDLKKDIEKKAYPYFAHTNAKCAHLEKITVIFLDPLTNNDREKEVVEYITNLNKGNIQLQVPYGKQGKTKTISSNLIKRFGCGPCKIKYKLGNFISFLDYILPSTNGNILEAFFLELANCVKPVNQYKDQLSDNNKFTPPPKKLINHSHSTKELEAFLERMI